MAVTIQLTKSEVRQLTAKMVDKILSDEEGSGEILKLLERAEIIEEEE